MDKNISNKMKGNIALLITAIIWGTGFIAQKIGMNTLTPLAFNGIRQLTAGLFILPLAIGSAKRSGYFSHEKYTLKQVEHRKKQLLIGGCICGIFLCIGSCMQQVGIVTISAGKSGFITSLYIIMVPVLGIFFGRKLTARTVLCIVLAISGFAMLSLRGGLGNLSIGDLITFLSNFGFAMQIIMIGRFINKDNSIMLSEMQLVLTGVVSLSLGLIFEHPALADFTACAPVILYAALLPSAVGYTLQIVGQKYTDPTTAAFLMSLESVFAAIFGAIFLGESMALIEICGCILIFIANVLCQIDLRSLLAARKGSARKGRARRHKRS